MILFVTGTDTGVGKTVACAWLALRARAAGIDVAYVKPVQTGLAVGERGSDADLVARFARVPAFELERYTQPLAPAVAAELEGATIDLDELVASIVSRAAGRDLCIVEGAGGLLVPITGDRTMADLAGALSAALVVVARPGLGTLNHTALTLGAARGRGLAVDRLVIADWPEQPGSTERTNLERLERLHHRVELLPHFEDLTDMAAAVVPPLDLNAAAR
jgi:dethiobiotin synthase